MHDPAPAGPAGNAWHVPALPATAQLWHAGQLFAVAAKPPQHTPSTHFDDLHCVFAVQALPLSLSPPHDIVATSQKLAETHWESPEQLVKHDFVCGSHLMSWQLVVCTAGQLPAPSHLAALVCTFESAGHD